jgi:SAM-dependent methyltransferase
MEKVGADAWRDGVVAFVERFLPAPPGPILEVGCGDGWLTRRLAASRYAVRGVDPRAPRGPLFAPVTLDAFDDEGPFAAIVAILSLHHISDLSGAVAKLVRLLAADGSLIVVEFAWDRFDDATAAWCLDRLPPKPGHGSWLHRRCAPAKDRAERGEPLGAAEDFQRWGREERMHPSSALLAALRGRFDERFFEWSAYLYPDLVGVTEAQERAAMEAGEIQPLGFRFVGGRSRQDLPPAEAAC